MKLIKQEEVNKAAFSYEINTKNIRQSQGFRAGVDYAEKEFSRLFPNGFESWYETFYEIVGEIELIISDNGISFSTHPIMKYYCANGVGAMYELARDLTDKFELLHKDREWDGEFFDEIEKFLETELKKE